MEGQATLPDRSMFPRKAEIIIVLANSVRDIYEDVPPVQPLA